MSIDTEYLTVDEPLVGARFAGRFEVVGKCWEWRGANSKGYGQISIDGRPRLVSRHVLSLMLGRPVSGCALHRCDNPPCMRPSHLYEGDMKQNARDRSDRGRSAVGERAGRAKLTRKQVLAIRADRKVGMSYRKLAARYGVTHQSIRSICIGQSWASVA